MKQDEEPTYMVTKKSESQRITLDSGDSTKHTQCYELELYGVTGPVEVSWALFNSLQVGDRVVLIKAYA